MGAVRAHADNSSFTFKGLIRGRTLQLVMVAVLGVGVGTGTTASLLTGTPIVARTEAAAPERLPPPHAPALIDEARYVTRDESASTVRDLRAEAAADRRQLDEKLDKQTERIIQTIRSQGK
jgi:hypothetical protein